MYFAIPAMGTRQVSMPSTVACNHVMANLVSFLLKVLNQGQSMLQNLHGDLLGSRSTYQPSSAQSHFKHTHHKTCIDVVALTALPAQFHSGVVICGQSCACMCVVAENEPHSITDSPPPQHPAGVGPCTTQFCSHYGMFSRSVQRTWYNFCVSVLIPVFRKESYCGSHILWNVCLQALQ